MSDSDDRESLKLRVRGPVLTSIKSQWEVLDIVTVDAIVHSEDDTRHACARIV
jgi:hypothetical protein